MNTKPLANKKNKRLYPVYFKGSIDIMERVDGKDDYLIHFNSKFCWVLDEAQFDWVIKFLDIHAIKCRSFVKSWLVNDGLFKLLKKIGPFISQLVANYQPTIELSELEALAKIGSKLL
jgi:hypothetical protein